MPNSTIYLNCSETTEVLGVENKPIFLKKIRAFFVKLGGIESLKICKLRISSSGTHFIKEYLIFNVRIFQL